MTTPSSPNVPGRCPVSPLDIYVPRLGEAVAVVGVRYDETLPVRNGPGTDFGIIDGLAPLGEAEGTGEGWFRPDRQSIWWRLTYDSSAGWVRSHSVARLGATDDATAAVVAELGGIPTAPTMLALGNIVADVFVPPDPEIGLRVTVVAAPTVGDLGEITLDVIGFGDDSVLGVRLVVFGTPGDGAGFGLESVERTRCAPAGRMADSASEPSRDVVLWRHVLARRTMSAWRSGGDAACPAHARYEL